MGAQNLEGKIYAIIVMWLVLPFSSYLKTNKTKQTTLIGWVWGLLSTFLSVFLQLSIQLCEIRKYGGKITWSVVPNRWCLTHWQKKYVLEQKFYDLGQLYTWEGQILLNMEYVEMLKLFFTCFGSFLFLKRFFSLFKNPVEL